MLTSGPYEETMIRQTFVIATFILVAAACGGSNDTPEKSGLSENAQVTSLSDSDLTALCTWSANYEGGGGTSLACNLTVNDPDQCFAGFRSASHCDITVSQVETCAYAVRADPCSALENSDCGMLQLCAL
jgi:hypothetical protein